MSSTMKPVMSQGSKTPSVSAQMNKQIHPQGIPTTYAQSISHMPQNLISVSHNSNVHSNAHSIAHHVNTNVHSSNHYSLNVPNASQHYPISGNSPALHQNTHAHSGIGHSVSSYGNPSKTPMYEPNYQNNQGQFEKNPNLPSVQNNSVPQTSNSGSQVRESESDGASHSSEKLQSNGTTENVSAKTEPKSAYPTSSVKDNKPPSSVSQQVDRPVSSFEKKEETSENMSTSQEKDKAQPLSVAKISEQKVDSVVKPDESSNSSSVDSNESEPLEKPISANSSDVPESTLSVIENVSSTPSSSEPSDSVSPKTTAIENDAKKEDTREGDLVSKSSSKEQTQQSSSVNPKVSTLKLATTTRAPVRKNKVKPESSETLKPTTKTEKPPLQRSPGSVAKAKRNRIRTQHYQSPLPEVEMISKMTSSNTPRNKNNEDRLIIFFKNEFLAVRNSEGSFYVCQAVQNIYKSSPRIRIRWLSQDKNDKSGELYTPDFYDYTDFDCILTNLNLERVEKGKFRLPTKEKNRTDNILKRALAVEMGDSKVPSLTEEHPDGIDLSLYKEESQLKKRRPSKRKASSPLRSPSKSSPAAETKKSPDSPKAKKVATPKSTKKKKQQLTGASEKKAVVSAVVTPKKASGVGVGRAERAKRRLQEVAVAKPAASAPIDSKKAKVLAKMAKKKAGVSVPASKNTKTVLKVSKPAPSKGQKQPPPPKQAQQQQQSSQQQQVRKSRRGKK